MRLDYRKYLVQRPITKRFAVYYIQSMKLYSKTIAKYLLKRFPKNRVGMFKKPEVLQLPITYKCNCDCIMCGMRELQHLKNFTYKELEMILSDELYSEIKYVGVNGGEPFIVKDIDKYINTIVQTLPKLKSIFIISNGYFTKYMLDKLVVIKDICRKNSVSLTLSISIDGVGLTHDQIRRTPGIFERAIDSYQKIKANKDLFCDYLAAICTITKANIININELEAFAKNENVEVSYNIATLHKRLSNKKRFEDFSIFSDVRYRMLASEFLYWKFVEQRSRKYFALWYFIVNMERITSCDFQNNGVTITPDCNISFCATKSKNLGNALSDSSLEIFKSELLYRKYLITNECKSCSHYVSSLTVDGELKYNNELLRTIGNPFSFGRVLW